MSKNKQEQIKALGQLKWSLRRIERETGIRRETISGYLKAAGIPVREAGRWGHGPPQPPNPAIEVITDSQSSTSNPAIETITDPRRVSSCEAYRDLIVARVESGCTAMSIFQELVDEHGYPHRYAAVGRFVRGLKSSLGYDAHPVIMTKPGEEAQVDYGDGPMVRDPVSGRYRRTRMFVLTLGFSRKSVWLLVWKSSSEAWCKLHQRAFARLGGVPKVIVLDNLKEGVLKPDYYEPELNPLYRDFLSHYGSVALPCKVRDPNRKGKVESAVKHGQGAVRGRRFESLESAQQFLDHWSNRWADTRIHGSTKRQVQESFESEKKYLLALPTEPFRFYERLVRKVNLNGCVEVEYAYYSVPPGFIGQALEVQNDSLCVRILEPHTGRLLREHNKQRRGGYRIHDADKPKKTPPEVTQLLGRAERAGRSIGTVCSMIHKREGQTGVRRIQGILGLCKKHGFAQVEDACAAALECASPNYRFVKNYLQRIEQKLKQEHPLIRELKEYQQLALGLIQQGENYEHSRD